MDWLALLRGIPEERRLVMHEPETPRYRQARMRLRYIVDSAEYLGMQCDPERERAVLVAVWAPPGHGRGAGYYCCFRIFFGEDGMPTFAVMYCFYDGTERSVSLKSLSAARAYARRHRFLPELP